MSDKLDSAATDAGGKGGADDEFADRVLGALGSALVARGDNGEVIVWNAAAERLLGWRAPDVLGRTFHDLGLPQLDDIADFVQAGLATSGVHQRELLVRCEDGQFVAALAQASRVAADGDHAVVIVLSDLTARFRTEQQLRTLQEQAHLLLQHSLDMLAVIDEAGTITFANAAGDDRARYDVDELIGRSAIDFVHPEDVPRVAEALAGVVADECPAARLVFRFRTRSGRYLWMEGRAVNLLRERSVRGVLVALHDVTERVETEAQLAHQATHDQLTGLPNRALFIDRLNHHLEHARRHEQLVAVLYWDLDNFKVVNDSAGHAVGDWVLVEAAKRAGAVMRAEDSVARLGGDEFVACAEVMGEAQVCALAERLLAALNIAVTLPGGQKMAVTASIGVAFGDGPPADRVLLEADRAMYAAKRSGGDAITVLGISSTQSTTPVRPEPSAI